MGRLINDETGDGTHDLGEKGINLGTTNTNGLWINLTNSSHIVIESVPISLDGNYSLPVKQNGTYSIILTANTKTPLTTLTTADPLPGYWKFTGQDHLNGIKQDVNVSQNISNFNFFIQELRPVIFGLFSLVNNPTTVDVQWNIHIQDSDVSGYEVQRSSNGNIWSAIATVPINNKSPQADYWTYNFTDNAPLTGTSQYRIKQVSGNGNFDISTPRQINRVAPPIPSCPCTVTGYVWDDKSGNGMMDLGERAINLGTTSENGLWMNLVNSLNQVVSSVPVQLDGSYSLTTDQVGTYSVIVSANQKQIQTTLTSADPLPGEWRYTAISNTMLTPDPGNHTGIISNLLVDKRIDGLYFFIKDFTPLIFNAFWLINNDQNVDLRWLIDLQEHILWYEIERSTDNINWNIIDYVLPNTKGPSDAFWWYSYLDMNPLLGQTYYRVRQRADDNTYVSSASLSVTRTLPPEVNCPCTISGFVWDDITGDNTQDLGERRLNLGTTDNNGIWVNLTNSMNTVVSSVPVTSDGQYSLSVQQKGFYSLIITRSQKQIGTSLSQADPVPAGWTYYNATNPTNPQNGGNSRNSSGIIQNFYVGDNMSFVWFSVKVDALPVILSKFTTQIQEDKVLLKWETTLEVNSHSFTIERSRDGKDWKQIGVQPSHADNSDTGQITEYSFVDQSPLPNRSYYRLKLLDNDDTFAYSSIKSVELSIEQIIIFPNPAKKHIHLRGYTGNGLINIYDKTGIMVKSKKLINDLVDIHDLSDGHYFILIEDTSHDIRKVGKLIKQ